MEVFLLCSLLFLVLCYGQMSWSFSQGPNNRNVSVDTRVNVTGSAPDVLYVSLQPSITLGAGGITTVTCNVSIRDYNGFADLDTVNATFFDTVSSSVYAADNNNTHYSNSSCSPIAGQQSGAFANYTCTFPVNFYAVNSSWNCSAFVNDSINLGGNNSNRTVVNELLALNVTTLIDYGEMNVGDISSNQTANITNMGNRPINITVKGYGLTIADGLSFVCEQGSLPIALERYSANITATYDEKQVLSNTLTQMFGLTVAKPTDAVAVLNTTYWQLYLDPAYNVFGVCNGTVVFQAERAS